MRFFHDLGRRWTARPGKLPRAAVAWAAGLNLGSDMGLGLGPGLGLVLCLGLALGLPGAARAQVVESAEAGGSILSVGVMGSGAALQYGQRQMLGITAFVDADAKSRIGIEAEARWLEFHQTANVHAETYSAGMRYHFDLGRFEPYAKGLIGFGDFNFPYNYAQGRYLVLTAGGGMDYVLSRRIHIRLPDFEYQEWPQFTYGAMSTAGVSAGLRVRIF